MTSRQRSLAKALTYRFVGTFISVLFLYLAGHGWAWAAGVGGLESLFKILAYYLHERAWARYPTVPAMIEPVREIPQPVPLYIIADARGVPQKFSRGD